MICKDCGKEYTPVTCPACGGSLRTDSCPACSEGSRVICTNCGQQLEIARVDAERSEGISHDGARPGHIPHSFGEDSADILSGEMADIEVAGGNLPPQPEHETSSEVLDRVMGAGSTPESPPLSGTAMPGEAADITVAAEGHQPAPPPPAYNTPPAPGPQAAGYPANNQANAQPAYNGQGSPPSPEGTQGGWPAAPYPGQQQYYSYGLPTQKVRLGGWLMVYYVFCIIGLVFLGISLINNLIGNIPSIPASIFTVICIVPTVMTFICIIQRSIHFRRWFLFRAILGFLLAGFLLVVAILLGVLSRSAAFSSYLTSELYGLMPYGSDFSYLFYDAVVGIFVAIFVVVAIITIAWYVVWLIYFKRSKRVAYTFDARNNPPRHS